jgi:acyl-coenzyme A thioesterase 9
VSVAPLVTETPEERRLFDHGQQNYNMKKSMSKTALRKQTPNDEESDLIHALWLRQLDYHGMWYDAND